MAASEQTVEGDHNIAINAEVGGNLHIGDVRLLADSQYFEPPLLRFAPGEWIDPPGAGALVDILVEQRLLILAGELEDKSECAKHLAYLLRQRLTESSGVGVQVRERFHGQDPQQIETAFHETDATIVLLVEVSPRQIVGYAPSKLRNLLRESRAYAIITTDNPREEWEVEAQLYVELSWETYYGREGLERYLVRLLLDADEPLPDDLLPEGPEGLLLCSRIPLAMAVQSLKIPDNVSDFARWLLSARPPWTEDEIEAELARRGGDPEARACRWYRELTPRDQLLALGLTLFDGLPDSLLFAGVELLVASAWRDLDPLLPHFDYQDLERFSAYFKRSDDGGGTFRMQCGSRERRRQILRAAWSLQRRRLLSTLPALTDMIRATAAAEGEDSPAPEATGAQGRREEAAAVASRALDRAGTATLQLDQALVESLSLISLLSIEVVKPHYLELAADPSDSVRQLIARALSTWRQDHEADLFALLEDWWTVSHRYESGSGDALLDRLARTKSDPRSAVRIAVALTTGFAARFDRANRLAPRLYQLLVELIDERDSAVRSALVQSTLPIMVAWHFRQLEPLLRTRVLLADDLMPAVAYGAAEACSLRPEESLALLDSWRAAARAERRRGTRENALLAERLLATVALTYGYIRCEDTKNLLSPAAICAKLRAILVEEGHPFVRHYAFHAIEQQAVRNYEAVALLLQELVSKITLKDRPTVVGVFTRTYLNQRQLLPGGEDRVDVDGESYGVWAESSRPLTLIEASLYGWLMDDSSPIAQQLAVDVFEALAETPLEKEERRWLLARRPSLASPRLVSATSSLSAPQLHALSGLGRMAVFLAAPRKKSVRSILEPLLAEFVVLQHRPMDPARRGALRALLLARWRGVSNDATRAITSYLERALGFYRWRWGLVFAALVLTLSLYSGSRALIHHLSQPSPVPIAAPRPPLSGELPHE